MTENFIITDICRVVLVGKNEYPDSKISFADPLVSNELIYHFSGKSTVHFNGKSLTIKSNTIRYLPKGENREYVVEKEKPGECIDIFFNTDIPLSDEAFTIDIGNSSQRFIPPASKLFSLYSITFSIIFQ